VVARECGNAVAKLVAPCVNVLNEHCVVGMILKDLGKLIDPGLRWVTIEQLRTVQGGNSIREKDLRH